MKKAKTGDKVQVNYTGKFDDGMIFDSSKGREPLEFTIGEHQVIPGFEDAIVGMQEGENKTIHINADDAYGKHHKELVIEVEKIRIPKDINVKLGQQLQINSENGEVINVIVTGINDTTVTLDANHPLAGKDLNFDIELVKIV
ncbi:FKBP-type peptidyl-prolyl cis-trans isomerase [candidate division WOR-3 bacterium]|nr:FKBP-type peptidyl-prolyl cis-trans isomerase [candidate division WOR-3 bacterium]